MGLSRPRSLQELKEVGKEQPRLEAEHPANSTKNRYPHLLPCEHGGRWAGLRLARSRPPVSAPNARLTVCRRPLPGQAGPAGREAPL